VKNDVMKRIIFSVFILYAYVGFSSCGGLLLKTPFKKSMEETTESVSVNEQNQVTAFLQELLTNTFSGAIGLVILKML
jgi:Na+/proline symporter